MCFFLPCELTKLVRIREWYQERLGDIDRKIEQEQETVNLLDGRQCVNLSEEEINRRRSAWVNLNSLMEIKNQIRFQ